MKICLIEVFKYNIEQLRKEYEIYLNRPDKLSDDGLNDLNNLVGICKII